MNPDTGYAGLRCLDCDGHLSASNPSRTAQEHFGLWCSTRPVCRVKAKDAAKKQRLLKHPPPEAGGLEHCDIMNLTQETCVRGSGGACTSASQQSMDRYIGPPAKCQKRRGEARQPFYPVFQHGYSSCRERGPAARLCL
eukprot:242801-Chlamydomonas_euryale.AAC.1